MMQNQSPFSFGGGMSQQQQQPATGQFSFGQSTQPQAQQPFSFGQQQSAQTQQPAAASFSFGQPAQQQQQSQFSFGAQTQQQQQPAAGAFSFGQSTQPQQQAAAAPFSFGQQQQAAAPQQNQFSFGQAQPAAQPASQFSFGQPPQQAAAPATQFSFGQPPQQAAAPATQFSFGQPTQPLQQQPAPTPAFSFGNTLQTQPQQQPAAAFSFGPPTQTQPQASTSGAMFSFGNTQTTMPGLGGMQTGLTSTLGGFAKPLAQSQPSTTLGGLGGVPGCSNTDSAFSTVGTTGTRPDQRAAKELPIPVELTGLLEELKSHMKTEKIKIAEVSRASYKPVEVVATGLDGARALLANVSNMIQRQTHSCEAFRAQINQDMKNAEMAQLTRETPAALQSEHHLPTEYFNKLVKDYEEKMATYSREIKKAEAAVSSIGGSPGVTAQDLCVALKSSKDALVVLAAKFKGIHDKVNGEIETHKNLLRFVHGDVAKDIFAARKLSTQDWVGRPVGDNSGSSMLFPNRVSDPTQMYMTYMAGSKNAPVGGVLHSAPIYTRTSLTPAKSYEQTPFNTSAYGSPTFFQTPTSPIFNPHNATSPPPSSGVSLKRSKH